MEMRAAAYSSTRRPTRPATSTTAERLVRAARAGGAELVALPEKWNLLGDADHAAGGRRAARRADDRRRRSWARELGIHLVAGSIAERVEGQREGLQHVDPDRARRRAGGRYRKIHMFDVDVGGVAYRESEHEEPGDELVTRRSGSSGRHARADRLLRPSLPRALPDPGGARGDA